MSVDYDEEREMAISRTRLQTLIPNRLNELHGILYARSQTEPWYRDLLSKLILGISRTCRDLLKTTLEEALPAAAWNARNLLELWVWTRYCAGGPSNARRFHEDALRDMKGLGDALAEMNKLAGAANASESVIEASLLRVAQSDLGLDSISPDYLKVSNAARAVGVEKLFSTTNRLLSKFAHPTAGLIIGVMHQDQATRGLQCVCTTIGVYYAGQCVILMEGMILGTPPGNPP